MPEISEYGPDLYTLVDEEGKEQTFELLDVMEVEDQVYYALVPYAEKPEDILEGSDELVVLKMEEVDGEEMLASIEDDDEFERIGQMFLDRIIEEFEGEEEIGSIHLPEFAKNHKELLSADACIYSDGCYHENGQPILILGLKGSVYTEITIHGANRETHSMRNACIPNPIWRMAKLLASMRGEGDMDGKVLIEGFYENVRPLSKLEIDSCEKIPVDEELIKTSYGIKEFVKCPSGGTYYYNLMFEPGCNVSGIYAGYIGKGFKGIIPNCVTARVNFSLVPDMKMAEIREKIERHVKKFGDDIELKFIEGGFEPSRTPIDNKYVEICAKAVEDGFGEYPIIFPGVGGAGPNYVFMDILGMPAIEIPFADALQNNHAPNESQVLSGFFNGIKTSAAVIERFPR